ncbi:MAG: hypothetical protein ABSH38_21095 [Verrucomicrobiota bacterium]
MSARPWLILSIGVNLFLAAGLYVATRPFDESTVPVSPPNFGIYVRTNVIVRHENFTWEQVETTNYVEFVKNLRAIGCPEQTIRDIITSEVNRLYARRKLSEVVYSNYQWWRSDPDPDAVRAAAAKIQSLDTERNELLTSLLGQGWNVETKEAAAARGGITLTGPILGDMPGPVKQAALFIIAAAQQKIDAYQEQQRLQNKPVDPMQMVRLREEPLVQLAAILSPEQYDEFALRYAPAAQQLREQMRGMNLAPAQFSDLFNALNSITGQPVYYYAGNDPQLLKQQQQLQAQTEAVIKETLGAQTYAAYQLNQDPLYRSAQAVAQQLQVPTSSVMPMYEINRATQAELNRIRNDDALSNDEKVEALAQTQVQQQQALEQIVGPEAFQRWLQTQGRAR